MVALITICHTNTANIQISIYFFHFTGDYKDGVRYTFNIYGCTEKGHKLLEIQTGYFLELS